MANTSGFDPENVGSIPTCPVKNFGGNESLVLGSIPSRAVP